MNPSNNTSAAMATRIALSTKAAGPSRRNVSKVDPIGQSKTSLTPVLCSFLISCHACHALAYCHLKAQTTAVRLRRETTDLVNLSKTFCPHRKEKISSEPA